MSNVWLAIIASVPGILLGVAALMKARKGDCSERLDRQREELDEAKTKIEKLTERVDECDRERRELIRENLKLYRRLDDKED